MKEENTILQKTERFFIVQIEIQRQVKKMVMMEATYIRPGWEQ